MKLNLDPLECRTVPATLFLNGGATADAVLILDYGGAAVEVVHNGRATTYTQIHAVEGTFRGGADFVSVLYLGTDPDRSRSYDLDLGDGNDVLTFGVPGGTPWLRGSPEWKYSGGAGQDKISLFLGDGQFGAPLNIWGDPHTVITGDGGNDSVWMDIGRTHFWGPTTFDLRLGSGNDYLECEQTDVGHGYEYMLNFLGESGDDEVNVVAQKVRGDGDFMMTIDAGNGRNVIRSTLNELTHAYSAMNFSVLSGDGADFAETNIRGVRAADGSVRVETGGGADQLLAELSHNDLPLGFIAMTEGGNDKISVDLTQGYESFGVQVDAGAGNDTASVHSLLWEHGETRETTEQTVSLLGGDGNDNLFMHSSFNFGFGEEVGAWHIKGQVLVDAGAGHDFVNVRGDYFGRPERVDGLIRVDVLGGRGNDTLLVQWPHTPSVDFAGLVDGGDGFDLAIASEKFAVRNCEG